MKTITLFSLVVLAVTGRAQESAAGRSIQELKAYYVQNCVKCHGSDGSAIGAEGKKLGGRDFTDARKMARETDEAMAKTLRKGIFFGRVMPAFKADLSEEESLRMIREVVRKAEKGKVIAPE